MSHPEFAIRSILVQDPGVAALVADRVMPWPLEQKATMPAITYLRVGGGRLQSQDGASGVGEVRLQLDAWGDTYLQAKDVAQAVRQAVDGHHGGALGVGLQRVTVVDEGDHYEAEAVHHRVRLDLSIWEES